MNLNPFQQTIDTIEITPTPSTTIQIKECFEKISETVTYSVRVDDVMPKAIFHLFLTFRT